MPEAESREERARRYRDEGWWRGERLTDDVRRHAEADGDALALVDGDDRCSRAEL